MKLVGRLAKARVGGGFTLLLLAFLLVPGATQSQGEAQGDDPEGLVHLRTADVTLRPGVYDTAGHRYVVLRLARNLRRAEIDDLSAAGVRLLSYLGDGAFIAGVDPDALSPGASTTYGIESAAPWQAENKAAPMLRQGLAPDWALSEGGLLKLAVLFFEDVAQSEMEAILGRHAVSYALERPPLLWAIEIEPSSLGALLQEQGIYTVEPGPIPFQPLLDESRALIHVDEVQQAGISDDPPAIRYDGLTGKGVLLQVSESVWEEHPDFQDAKGQSRVQKASSSGSDHGTSVAGIMAGNGKHSESLSDTPFYGQIGRWRGMAPEALLYEGTYMGDEHLVDASNHSWVMDYGNYGGTSAVVDREIRGDSNPAWQWPQIWAAGNNGLTAQHDNEEGYYSMYAPAKNSIAVGSVNANDGSLSTFVSSLGPTFDGRIKPDVMAPGSKNHLPPAFDLFEDRMELEIDYIRVYDSGTGSLDAAWEFNEDGNPEGWFQTGAEWRITDVDAAGGKLTCRLGFWPEGGNVYPFGWKTGVDIKADPDHEVVIKYKMSTPAGSTEAEGEFWWHFGKDTGQTGVDGVIRFPVVANGSWVVESIPVGEWGQSGGAFGGWTGNIDALGMVPFSFAWPGIVSPAYFEHDDYCAYRSSQGTSEAAPAVTGSVALILQQFREGLDIDVRNDPPQPSTIKALLVQTAQDMVHPTADPRDPDNPDTGTPVLYYEGPDFASGYGLVDIEAAVDLVAADPGPGAASRYMHEGDIDALGQDVYEMWLTSTDVAGLDGDLKFTLAWDDREGSPATLQTAPKLVNDLDLTLIDPDGVTHLPWTLDPLPIANCGGDGPGCGDLDPIDSDDIVPAKRAADHRNNVEMVQVSQPKAGHWQVVVDAHDVPLPTQPYSLVGNQLFRPAIDYDHQIYLPITRRNSTRRLTYGIQTFRAGYWYTGLSLPDMNRDGRPDFLIGNRDTNSLEIWTYNASYLGIVMIGDVITFPHQVHDAKAADFDWDGDMDVVVGLRSGGLYYAEDTSLPGTPWTWGIRKIAGGYTWQVLVEDFDGDGHLDILDCQDYGPIRTFYGDGKGNFAQGASIDDPDTNMRQPLGLNAVDIDGDGALDLIGLDGAYLRVFFNPGDRTSDWDSGGQGNPFGQFPDDAVRPSISPSAGDLDGNGVVDQVAVRENRPDGTVEVLVFEGDEFGGVYSWTERVLDAIPGAGWAGHAGVADLDGDGHLDVHVGGAERFDGLYVYFGDGKGGFTREWVYLGHGVGGMNSFGVGDLDGDGLMDLITPRYESSHGQFNGFEVLWRRE